jgi:hypothetical protein
MRSEIVVRAVKYPTYESLSIAQAPYRHRLLESQDAWLSWPIVLDERDAIPLSHSLTLPIAARLTAALLRQSRLTGLLLKTTNRSANEKTIF